MSNIVEIESKSDEYIVSARFERVVRDLAHVVILDSYTVDKEIPVDLETGDTLVGVSAAESKSVFERVKERMIEEACSDLGMDIDSFIEAKQ